MNRLHRLLRTVLSRAGARSREDQLLEEFQQEIGLHFRNQVLLKQALTHRSFVYDHNGDASQSNERMEFLGDSVLGLVVNEHLYKLFPNNREGSLTQMKSLLVSEAVLSKMARSMHLGQYLLVSEAEAESGGRDRSSILADAFEAVIGAIYLDSGIEAARRFTELRLLREAGAIVRDESHINHKSLLQEYAQGQFKTHPRYRVTREEGPDHEKVFSVEVFVGERLLGRGSGKNKKDAEQDAARDAIGRLEADRVAGRLPAAAARQGRRRRGERQGPRRGPGRQRFDERSRSG